MGYSPSLFWDSSLQEVYDLIESYSIKQNIKVQEYEADLKARISLNAVLARQIGEYVASLFNSDSKISSLGELFPELFKDEQTSNNDMALYKARMEEYVYRHNQKIRKEE